MVTELAKEYSFSDERGSLLQLFHNESFQINVLKSKKGVIRGNHFHEKTTEYFYVLSGSVEISYENGKDFGKQTFESGSLFRVDPMTSHSLFFLDDCEMIAFYDKPIEDELGQKDIFRK